ncbi:MAG: hypothetical protein IH624_16630 [Phycisphaerae bacterium]|nr:hypothetical protein [Phycisphaerae bacterium]
MQNKQQSAGIARMLVATALLCTAGAFAGVYNVKVVTDATPDYSDMDSMIASITDRWPGTEEKCLAMFYWNHLARRQTSPMNVHGLECTDPIRQFNDYGYTMCSTVAGINCSIWQAMGLNVRFWDITAHTVSEVEYDGRWHVYDNSMSALYTLCDGRTLAGVEDVGRTLGCAASGGHVEFGHIALYHCLTATSANGFLTGADCPRDLDQEARCFNPHALKHRTYYLNQDRGHRYILNLRPGETYTRHYASLGATPEYYVPNNGKDPESTNPRYRIRGNGVWTFEPVLRPDEADEAVYMMTGCTILPCGGIAPAHAGRPAEAIFRIQGANVITSMVIDAAFLRKTPADLCRIAVSTTHGATWKDVWTGDATGTIPLKLKLVNEVNGSYEVLVRVRLTAAAAASDARLERIAFETTTMLNSKTQPRLLLGANTVYVGAGDQTESVVLWPDLRRDHYRAYVYEEKNIAARTEHPGYQGVMHAVKANEEAFVVFRVDTPDDIVQLTYGGRFYNRAPRSSIRLFHSFDNGRTWRPTYALTSIEQPWDVIHNEKVDDVPAGSRSVLFKYALNGPDAGHAACSLYGVRMEVNYRPANTAFEPMEVTFDWSEAQEDYSLVKRSHTELITRLPHKYTINVAGADHPVTNALKLRIRGKNDKTSYGYSDGRDAGGKKYVPTWATYGTNLAEGKPYTVSIPSGTSWDAGDPENKKLTDGVAGPPYPGGVGPRYALLWSQGQKPKIDVDLGRIQACGGFRIQLGSGWPWWDALKGEIRDRVEVFTSVDGAEYTPRGQFKLNLRRKDIPINHLMPDDETAGGFLYDLPLTEPAEARYVRFLIAAERSVTVSEVQVLDSISYTPFDLRLALPDEARNF